MDIKHIEDNAIEDYFKKHLLYQCLFRVMPNICVNSNMYKLLFHIE